MPRCWLWASRISLKLSLFVAKFKKSRYYKLLSFCKIYLKTRWKYFAHCITLKGHIVLMNKICCYNNLYHDRSACWLMALQFSGDHQVLPARCSSKRTCEKCQRLLEILISCRCCCPSTARPNTWHNNSESIIKVGLSSEENSPLVEASCQRAGGQMT